MHVVAWEQALEASMREANGEDAEDQPVVAPALPGLISVLVVSREVSRARVVVSFFYFSLSIFRVHRR